MLEFDPNKAYSPALPVIDYLPSQYGRRIFAIIAPFLNLNPPFSRVYTPTIFAYQSISLMRKNLDQSPSWSNFPKYLLTQVVLIAQTVLYILSPKYGALFTHCSLIVKEFVLACQELIDCQFYLVCCHLYQLMTQVCHATNHIYAYQPLKLASILFTVIESVKQASGERRIPERIGQIILSLIHTGLCVKEANKLKTDWYGNSMTQDQWESLASEISVLRKAHPSRQIDLHELLYKRGFRNELVGIDFSTRFQNLSKMAIEDLTFSKSILRGRVAQDSHFNNVSFSQCDMANGRITKSYLDFVTFDRTCQRSCTLSDNRFIWAQWNRCDLTYGNLHGSSFIFSNFVRCVGKELNFFHVSSLFSRMERCDLSDAFLFGAGSKFRLHNCVVEKTDRPTVAITWNMEKPQLFAGYAEEVLRQRGAKMMRFEYSPKSIDSARLAAEVLDATLRVKQGDNIVQTLLQEAKPYGQIAKVKRLAQQLLDESDALFLSGGLDVEELFYKRVAGFPQLQDVRRSMIEFALLNQRGEKPVMGVCRGLQMANVFSGGTLRNTEHGVGFQTVQVSGEKPLIAFSAHNQCVDKLGSNLRVSATYKDVVKAMEMTAGDTGGRSSGIFTQFHPGEALLEGELRSELKSNENFVAKYGAPDYEWSKKVKNGGKFIEAIRAQIAEKKPFVQQHLERNLNYFDRFLATIRS